MCCVCGREYCLSCYEEWNDFDELFKETRKCSQKRQHYKEQLVPIYHYTKEEILRLFDQCNQMILDDEDNIDLDEGELPDDDTVNLPVESSRDAARRQRGRTPKNKVKAAAVHVEDSVVPSQDNGIFTPLPQICHDRTSQAHDEHKKIEYGDGEITEEIFRDLWKKGYPFMIRGVDNLDENIWRPNYFITHYGSKYCTVIDVKEDVEYKMDVQTFFKGFEDISRRFMNKNGIYPCLKLKVYI